MGWIESVVLGALPHVPRGVLRRLSARYIAGETLEEALQRLDELAGRGHAGILNLLGEDVRSEAAAHQVLEEFATAARALGERGADAYVLVKPTHLGLRISEDLAKRGFAELLRRAAAEGVFVRMEMEDHTTTDATLRIFESLRGDFDNFGLVLQARLHRTPEDVACLAPGPVNVRLVKGIYLEPAEIAHVDPAPIRDAFEALARQLLERGAFVGFATHDAPLAERLVRHVEPGDGRHEFQVLMGVQEPLWEHWKSAGHPVRVYVPYGPEWRPYSLRRMRKNPQILRHVMRQTFRL